jgi:hypothetical protein
VYKKRELSSYILINPTFQAVIESILVTVIVIKSIIQVLPKPIEWHDALYLIFRKEYLGLLLKYKI